MTQLVLEIALVLYVDIIMRSCTILELFYYITGSSFSNPVPRRVAIEAKPQAKIMKRNKDGRIMLRRRIILLIY